MSFSQKKLTCCCCCCCAEGSPRNVSGCREAEGLLRHQTVHWIRVRARTRITLTCSRNEWTETEAKAAQKAKATVTGGIVVHASCCKGETIILSEFLQLRVVHGCLSSSTRTTQRTVQLFLRQDTKKIKTRITTKLSKVALRKRWNNKAINEVGAVVVGRSRQNVGARQFRWF